ncbi:MAG: Asp-tRNA(Asn)/Glu-tRNA(Gln) amidotransferase subunit GatB [Patescibacteria group bacterium]
MDYKLTVGLEIHAELNTRTKMFCDSMNDSDEKSPNVNICPICMGYPGTLPTINKAAVLSVLRLGTAVGGELADYSEFDRKNYFYPDIPKGYQISQYKHPLVKGGKLAGIALTRIHLEEDTAKSVHTKTGESHIDFNRAGVPLVELVTEPDIHDAKTAAKFAKEFQLLLTYLDITHANMEKGELRLEANISVSRSDLKNADSKVGPLGTKVEVKNLNSFRSVERAIKFEFERQAALLDKGESVIQETRGWDETAGVTVSQRLKEESHDYRYFPDPDLPKLFISEIPDFARTVLAKGLPELPWEKRERLLKLGITREHAEIYVTQPEWGSYFEEVAEILKEPRLIALASNYITSELKTRVNAMELTEVVRMIDAGGISSRGAKEILKALQTEGGTAQEIADKNNLLQISDREVVRKFVEDVIKENPKAPIQFLVGQVMKKSFNRANPEITRELLLEMLDS